MKQTLALITSSSIENCSKGLDQVLNDLREELGENRFGNQLYSKILELSIVIGDEYIRREREKAGL